MKKILLWIFRCIGILVIIGAVISLSEVLHGGSVTEIRSMRDPSYSPLRELYGSEGIIQCICGIGVGIGCLLATISPKERNSKSASQIKIVYPYCRWWQDKEGKWYSEENPQTVKEYPETGICPLCQKRIEKIEI